MHPYCGSLSHTKLNSFNSDTGIRIHVASLTGGVAGVIKTIDHSVSKDAVGHLVNDMSITGSRLAVVVRVHTPPVWEHHLVVFGWPSSKVIVVRYSLYFDGDQQHSSIDTESSSGRHQHRFHR